MVRGGGGEGSSSKTEFIDTAKWQWQLARAQGPVCWHNQCQRARLAEAGCAGRVGVALCLGGRCTGKLSTFITTHTHSHTHTCLIMLRTVFMPALRRVDGIRRCLWWGWATTKQGTPPEPGVVVLYSCVFFVSLFFMPQVDGDKRRA